MSRSQRPRSVRLARPAGRSLSRISRSSAVLPGIACLWTVSCGNARTGPSPTSIERPEVVHQTVHAGSETPVFLHVEPSSICKLHSTGLQDIPVYGDVRGVATFSTLLRDVNARAELSLECTSPRSGKVVVHSIALRAVPDDQETSAPTADLEQTPFPGRTVAALADHQEQRASKTSTLVETQAAPQTGVVNAISQGNPSDKWAGYVTSDYAGTSGVQFTEASGSWTVPTLSRVPNTSSGFWDSSAWVGLGGMINTPADVAFPQLGTTHWVSCGINRFGFLQCSTFYFAWVEYFPANSQAVVNLAPGDQISAQVYFVNGAGDPDPAGTSAALILQRTAVSNGVTTTFRSVLSPPPNNNYNPPLNTQPYKDSAEWIMERPMNNGSLTSLARFSDTTFSYPSGQLNQYPWSFGFADGDAQTESIEMDSAGFINGVYQSYPLATVSAPFNNGTAFTVHWNAAN